MTRHTKEISEINNKLILNHLKKYFKQNSAALKIVVILLNKENKQENKDKIISLRVIDWFICNYCKKHNIVIKTPNNVVNIYNDYKLQLKAYSKLLFDPFKRHFKIDFYYNNSNFITTTIGQLNFLKWLIENNIYNYILEHKQTIIKKMLDSTKIIEKKKAQNKSKKQFINLITNAKILMHF